MPTDTTSTDTVISILNGLSGTILGAAISIFVSKRSERLKETLSLHKEFNDEEMQLKRNEAYKLLVKYPKDDFNTLSKKLTPAETNSLWTLTGFYTRLWLAIKYDPLKVKLIPELFGELIVWWYLFAFRDRLLPVDWESARNFADLYGWLKKHAKPSDFQNWEARAIKALTPPSDETQS